VSHIVNNYQPIKTHTLIYLCLKFNQQNSLRGYIRFRTLFITNGY